MGSQNKAKFANRRPDWELPNLNYDLKLSSHGPLDECKKRQPCPRCGRSRWLFCYDCLVPFTSLPHVQLPFTVSIITHHEECASKNTGVHAAILAPDHVRCHRIDACPPIDRSRAVVMFPSPDALDVTELEAGSVDHVFIIDSKWEKARRLVQHPALAGIRAVRLGGSSTSGDSPRSCCDGGAAIPDGSSSAAVFDGSGDSTKVVSTSGDDSCRIVIGTNGDMSSTVVVSTSGHSSSTAVVNSSTAVLKGNNETAINGSRSGVSVDGTAVVSGSGGGAGVLRSAFWRFHTEGVAEEGVCTIECLWHLVRAITAQGAAAHPSNYDPHAYDDLLWYFAYQHAIVAKAAQQRAAAAAATVAAAEEQGTKTAAKALTGVQAEAAEQVVAAATVPAAVEEQGTETAAGAERGVQAAAAEQVAAAAAAEKQDMRVATAAQLGIQAVTAAAGEDVAAVEMEPAAAAAADAQGIRVTTAAQAGTDAVTAAARAATVAVGNDVVMVATAAASLQCSTAGYEDKKSRETCGATGLEACGEMNRDAAAQVAVGQKRPAEVNCPQELSSTYVWKLPYAYQHAKTAVPHDR